MRHLVKVGKTKPIQTQSKPIKANLLNAQMDVNIVLTKDYENMSNWAICENKANSNPIRTQSNPKQTQYKVNFRFCGEICAVRE